MSSGLRLQPNRRSWMVIGLKANNWLYNSKRCSRYRGHVRKKWNVSLILPHERSGLSTRFLENRCSFKLLQKWGWKHHIFISIILYLIYMHACWWICFIFKNQMSLLLNTTQQRFYHNTIVLWLIQCNLGYPGVIPHTISTAMMQQAESPLGIRGWIQWRVQDLT